MDRDAEWEIRGRGHEKLDVWRLSIDLAEFVWKFTSSLPKEERYVLVSQMRRSALSIPSNIAEGAARVSPAEKARFYTIARGSAAELETQFVISARLGFVSRGQFDFSKLDRITAMLSAMIRKQKSQH